MRNPLVSAFMAVSLCLLGCTSIAQQSKLHTADVQISDDGVIISNGDQKLLSVEFDAELEASASADDLLLWRLDNADQVSAARLLEGRVATYSFDAPNDVKAICLKRRSEHDYDLFLGDGDGVLVHYWLSLSELATLQEVRRIWTNPDVEYCHVTADQVYVENGPLGVTAFALDEETDLFVSAVDVSPASLHPPLSLSSSRFSDEQPGNVVTAAFETMPVGSVGDAADDAVVLVAADTPPLIVGTDKQWGLHVYNLEGQQVAQIDRGRLNNVDGLYWHNGTFLLAASNRSLVSLDLLQAHGVTGAMQLLASVPLDLDDPYGLCMSQTGVDISVFVGGTDGTVQHWQVAADAQSAALVRSFQFNSQTEGCVVDTAGNRLFVGEEAVGIWSVDLRDGQKQLVARVEAGGLVADVEGLDICNADGRQVLIASSQGDDAFMVFRLSGDGLEDPLKFRITADLQRGIDGVSETDGLACSNASMPGFPRGVLVVQDGRNRAPEDNQNFKIVDWRQIEALLR
ncbi:MAG: phytase [bacterium]